MSVKLQIVKCKLLVTKAEQNTRRTSSVNLKWVWNTARMDERSEETGPSSVLEMKQSDPNGTGLPELEREQPRGSSWN